MWKHYRKKQTAEMRPFVLGEDLGTQKITINDQDRPPREGGMIARNPDDHTDQWYISPEKFNQLYDTNPVD